MGFNHPKIYNKHEKFPLLKVEINFAYSRKALLIAMKKLHVDSCRIRMELVIPPVLQATALAPIVATMIFNLWLFFLHTWSGQGEQLLYTLPIVRRRACQCKAVYAKLLHFESSSLLSSAKL